LTTATTARPSTRPQARPLLAWGTPVFQADFDDAGQYNPKLREMILEAEKTDPDAALFGGINAVKSSQNLLTWDHPAIAWVRARITDAVTALTGAELGEAAREVVSCGIQAEAWAVVYRSGGSLRPHTHHDSAWSGVYYVEAGDPGSGSDAGYLQLLDPRPAAIARQASAGVQRIRPVPGRMAAFPGWLPHSVQATATGNSLRICIAWNVAYDKTWSPAS
jgi:uncharacterized protein (TIGR02466 family)